MIATSEDAARPAASTTFAADDGSAKQVPHSHENLTKRSSKASGDAVTHKKSLAADIRVIAVETGLSPRNVARVIAAY
jgi:hypothetical protein